MPFKIENGTPVGIPSSLKVPISLSIVYSRQNPDAVEALTWALSNGHIVDVDVQFTADDKSYDLLEESLTSASKDANPESVIVICSCRIVISSTFSQLIFHCSECAATSGRLVLAPGETAHSSDVQGVSGPHCLFVSDSQHLHKVPPTELA